MEQPGSNLAFSPSGQEAIGRHVDVQLNQSVADTIEYFDILSTAEWIINHNFKRVALQFPDELMTQSIDVVQVLQKQTVAEIVILADTSYGSCCVDEVAAEHYSCDAIVHYGHACLSPTPGKIPVRYVFGRMPLDVELVVQQVSPLFVDDTSQPTLLLYDPVYQHAVNDTLTHRLQQLLPNLIVSRLCVHENNQPENSASKEQYCFGRTYKLVERRKIGDYTILYIGSADSRFLSAVLMTVNHSRSICFDPVAGEAITDFWKPGRSLARRYYLVERTRDAQRIGILMGTLGVANYLNVANKIEIVAKRAGKAVYRFVVGKLNVAKLANFADIDVFVLVACPENSLLDSKEFYQPIVTPFELEIACDTSRQWTGNYELDFKQLFVGCSTDEAAVVGSGDCEPDMSLITGRVRMIGHDACLNELAVDCCKSGALLKRNDATTVAVNSASNFFTERTWQGLDPQLGKTRVVKAVEGPCGIAMHYNDEPPVLNTQQPD